MTDKKNTLTAKVLVVEDDLDLREALIDTLELAGATVFEAASAEEALTQLELQLVDMVVSDVNMGGNDGLWLQKQIRKLYPQIPVLLITAYGSISASVEAMRNGAVDYLVKPFKPQLLVQTLANFLGSAEPGSIDEPIAVDQNSQRLLQLARRVAGTESTVLISGESGTGKEVLARYIHNQSARADQPFVAINCAAIPENMLEATLFGHEKGAFTGAYASVPGKFEQANGGTLLLDEISEMDIGLQAKLLRVIQEREVERLGGRKLIPLDVRIIATTNRALQERVAEGYFREDLYYRLSVLPLNWLPLRQRVPDILPIAQRLLNKHISKMGRANVALDESAVRAIEAYEWPGNVRELDNVMQRALIFQAGSYITEADLCIHPEQQLSAMESSSTEINVQNVAEESKPALGSDLQKREYEIILDTLRDERGSRKITAERLGISPRTLRYKLAKMRESGIQVEALLQQC